MGGGSYHHVILIRALSRTTQTRFQRVLADETQAHLPEVDSSCNQDYVYYLFAATGPELKHAPCIFLPIPLYLRIPGS